MSITHIPFYPSDWLAGTRGMTSHETGVYITLIAKMYEMAGPIERNEKRLARLCGCQLGHFKRALEFLIEEGKITVENDTLFNDKAKAVIKSVTHLSDSARQAAEARWSKKRNKNNEAQGANAYGPHMPKGCQPKPKPKRTPIVPKGTFDEFWQSCFHRNGIKQKKPQAEKAFTKAVKDGADPAVIIAAAKAHANTQAIKAEYKRGPVPWLNQRGWEDEITQKREASIWA